MKYLFIAEKPSLMRSVLDCYRIHTNEIRTHLGGSIDFVALSGHVCTNFEPNDYEGWDGRWDEVQYPMVPSVWGIKAIADEGKQKTLNDIKRKLPSYGGIIVGTDSDVEGYGIYYMLEQYLGISDMKALRFMEHSLTDKEILHSLLTMTDLHTDPVHIRSTQSYLIRSRADWLYGMNATRLMTLKANHLMAIGRVKAPTIKLVYDNSASIDNFKPTTYLNVTAEYDAFAATLVGDDLKPFSFKQRNEIPAIPLEGYVKDKKAEKKETSAPRLYDLASLQIEAGQMFGMSPEHVLEVAQSLYEQHKAISYPRTQCRYVSSEKAREFPDLLKQMGLFPPLGQIAEGITEQDINRVQKNRYVVNDKEVGKESHDALLPTSTMPDLTTLTKDEVTILNLIYRRLLAQFLPKLTENQTRLYIQHGDYLFYAYGKEVTEQGWRVLYGKAKDAEIPVLNKGQAVNAKAVKPKEITTKPPKRLTEATLLSAMTNIANQIEDEALRKSLAESKGIGTPATRASIISDIINKGYIEVKGKQLYITPLGKTYVESLQGIDILYPEFAAVMDMEIKNVQRGDAEFSSVYQKVLSGLSSVCNQIMQADCHISAKEYNCPLCGGAMASQAYSFVCSSCGVKIEKKFCGRAFTDEEMDLLMDGKATPRITFTKKDKSKFRTALKLTPDGLTFTSGFTCPYCKSEMRSNRAGVFCDCGLKIFNPCFGKTLTDREITTLLQKGKTGKLNGFVKKDGSKYSAALALDNKTVVRKF